MLTMADNNRRGTGHYSTSAWDPTNANHITVQMTNATLRSQGRFQILHWRPSGPNAWAPTTTDAAAHAKKKNDRRLKKQRARLNAAARQQGGGTQPGSSSSSGPAAAPAAPRPAAPQSSLAFVPRNVAQRPAVPANNPAAPRPAAGPANPAAPRPAAGPANPAAPRPAGSQSSLAFVPRNVAKKAAAKKSSTSGS